MGSIHNITAIVAVSGRKKIVRQVIPLLKEQVSAVVVVGSDSYDHDIVSDLDVIYAEAPNSPLSMKYQCGFLTARETAPDAVLLLGSDDFITKDWCSVCYKYIQQGYDLVGKSTWFYIVLLSNSIPKLYKLVYRLARVNEPIGAGRMFSPHILNRINWQPFTKDIDRGCDSNSYAYLRSKGANILSLNANSHTKQDAELIQVASIKGTWECINSYEQVLASAYQNKTISVVKTVKDINAWFDTIGLGFGPRLKSIEPTIKL